MYGKRTLLFNIRLLLCGLALLTTSVVWGEVYKYQDMEGNLVFTDRPLKGPYKLMWQSNTYKANPIASSNYAVSEDISKRRAIYAGLIEDAAKDHNVNADLLHAVIRAESSYNPNAISRAGAVGLMQLMPGTASRYGVFDRTDPAANIRGGAAYLRDLLDMFDENLQLALAGYNAGENAVIGNGYQIPPYPETRQYVTRVLSYYHQGKSSAIQKEASGSEPAEKRTAKGASKPRPRATIAWSDS